jgi:PAS domain S-box-containing protein
VISKLRNSLRLQLVLLIGGLALSSAVGCVLLTTRLVQRQIEADQLKLQRILVTRMASQLDQDMNARTVELRFIAGLDRLRDPTQSLERKQALLLAQQASYPFYAWIGVTDAQGRIIASTEPRINGADVSTRSWFLRGRQHLHHEDLHDATLLGQLLPRPELDDQPLRLMDIALPLYDHDGRFIGVLGAHLSLDWTYRLRNHLLDQLDGTGMELILVNRSGDVIVGNASLPIGTDHLARLNVVQRAQTGQISTAVETWPDGKRYLTAAAPALGSHPYPGLGWTALVRLDEDTAFAGARRLGWLTLVLGLSSALGFSGIIWWAVGRKLRPMERLSQAAAELDIHRPHAALSDVEGDGEVAVFARSMGRMVNALGESRERFQTLLDKAPVAMAFVEPDGRLQFLNVRFTELLGYDLRHLPDIEHWFVQAFPEGPAREEARARWHQVRPHIGLAASSQPTFEHEVRCLDGSTRIVETSGIALPDGLLVSLQDLTERRRAEAGLRLWAEAFEHSDVGFMIADVKTNAIIAANPAFARQRGYPSGELNGMPVKCLYPAHATSALMATLERVNQQDHVVFETEHIARDGRVFPVLIDVTLLRDRDGKPLRRIAYVQDLTERERAAQEIRRLNAELEQRVVERTAELSAANRELNSFAYTVSHDLRAPLRTINGFVQILQTEFSNALGDEGRDHLQRIQNGTRRMGELIEGLLALSRHTNKPLERESVNLSAIAQRRLAELAAADPARHVTLTIERDLFADCDAALAEALMVNLLDNAWKYSAKTDQARIGFGRGEVDGLQGFCVCDNGAGFDMAKAGHLFEPFQRMHHPSQFQGTGVGLATVRRIVDRHGGRITAHAAPGEGARFCFTLQAEA